MQPALASTAVLTGDIDYNGAVTGVIGGAVRGRPMKALLFTVARPLQYLMSKKEIKSARELKGKKIAGSSPRRHGDFPHGDAFEAPRIRS